MVLAASPEQTKNMASNEVPLVFVVYHKEHDNYVPKREVELKVPASQFF